jgi:glycosyltransferase involved in cell wall biosynthesis
MRVKRPFISVIIPAYNASVGVTRLLTSLKKSKYKQFEVIIGDDASDEPLHTIIDGTVKRCAFPITVVRSKVNQGPAGARNNAAKRAKGVVLLFLDSDVEVYPNTVEVVAKYFDHDEDLTALTGVWDKEQRTKRFFPQFKALRDWSYWINERDSDGYYYLFSTRVAAIRRKVFQRLGGFNVEFRQMEDVEITYRIARRYAIIFSPDVRVHHEFEGFLTVAKKYFWRSYYWTRLYNERKKFDPVATTLWESIAALTGVGSIGIFVLGMVLFFVFPYDQIRYYTLALSFILLGVHIFLIRKFLFFVRREKGIIFMMKSLFIGLLLYSVIVAGSIYFRLRMFMKAHL